MNVDFVEETTTSIAGTSGDGAVTLTALQTTAPGRARFSNVLGTSTARLVRYTIEDITASAGKFEKGIGSVNNNVLTRTSPRETWDGSTYKTTGATALQFGSSPTSGNIRVRCSPQSSSLLSSIPFYISSLGDDPGILPQYISGSSATQIAYSTSTQYFFPYYWTGDGSITQAAVYCSTSSANTHIQCAIYEIGSDGLPGRMLLQFNSMSLASSGVWVKDTTTGTWGGDLASQLWLPPGWYWLSWEVDSASPKVSGCVNRNITGFNSAAPIGIYAPGSSSYWGSQLLSNGSATFGTFPNPRTATLSITSAGSSSVGPPIFALKPVN